MYDFSGLLAPIDALPVVNKAKAGSSLPVKFSLGGDFGLDVLAGGSPGSQDVPCGSGATDTLEQTLSTNKSGLSYDATTGVYTYVWSTKNHLVGHMPQPAHRLGRRHQPDRRLRLQVSTPNGIRTRATAVKGRGPGPLDDGGQKRGSA